MGKEHQVTIDYILSLDEPARSLMLQLRELVMGIGDGIRESFNFKIPFYFLNDTHFIYFIIKPKYVLMGFCWGDRINDTFGELIATDRKSVRHFKIEYGKEYNEEALIFYIEESIRLQGLYHKPFGKRK